VVAFFYVELFELSFSRIWPQGEELRSAVMLMPISNFHAHILLVSGHRLVM
jgi:hypothetical protein